MKTRVPLPRLDARGRPSGETDRMREPRRGGECHLPGGITDLELSGAPQLATRAADRGRPTRPLERLVIPTGHKRSGDRRPTHTCRLPQRPQAKATRRRRRDSRRWKPVANVDCLKTRRLLPRLEARGAPAERESGCASRAAEAIAIYPEV